MRDVVEHQAGDSDGSKDFRSRCELCLRKAGVIGKERIGHEALEPLGFVVQFTKRDHVLNALFKRFNRTKQHGAVRGKADLVGLTMDLYVLLGTLLAVADDGSHFVVQDFCTASRK